MKVSEEILWLNSCARYFLPACISRPLREVSVQEGDRGSSTAEPEVFESPGWNGLLTVAMFNSSPA
jgi:hypothetical protein